MSLLCSETLPGARHLTLSTRRVFTIAYNTQRDLASTHELSACLTPHPTRDPSHLALLATGPMPSARPSLSALILDLLPDTHMALIRSSFESLLKGHSISEASPELLV